MGTRAGIKSQERVKKHGEVFTPNSIVNDMLNLVDEQIRKGCDSLGYIKQTYLEPACGDGQFLIVVLERKLNEVNKLPVELRPYGFVLAFCTIYGVDIQADNVEESIDRMLSIAKGEAVETFDLNNKTNVIQFKPDGFAVTDDMLKTIEYVLRSNIVCGNTLETSGDGNLLLFNYTFNDASRTISIETDKLHDEDQLSIFGSSNMVVGENVPFDKLYTLKNLEYFKSCEQAPDDPDENDFEF